MRGCIGGRPAAEAAAPRLARATGDDEIREWARDELRALDVPAPPSAIAAVRRMADGPVPEDPADDVVWVATVIVLAEDAIDLATAGEPSDDAGAAEGLVDLADLLGDEPPPGAEPD